MKLKFDFPRNNFNLQEIQREKSYRFSETANHIINKVHGRRPSYRFNENMATIFQMAVNSFDDETSTLNSGGNEEFHATEQFKNFVMKWNLESEKKYLKPIKPFFIEDRYVHPIGFNLY